MGKVQFHDNAKHVLKLLLGPLAKHALLAGIGARDIETVWRVVLVSEASRRQIENNSRVNVAGIAAATGISRAEVAKILRSLETKSSSTPVAKPHSINRVLAVWNSNPVFATRLGRPKELRIYGPGQSFESLVKKNAGGLPIRAVLDELLRLGSVEVMDSRKVRLISAVPRNRGQSALEIKKLAEQVTNLLDSMLQRLRSSGSEVVISTIDGEMDSSVSLPMFRKQVQSGSEDLLTDLRENFFGSPLSGADKNLDSTRHHVRVAVIYQEAATTVDAKLLKPKRRNYRRVLS